MRKRPMLVFFLAFLLGIIFSLTEDPVRILIFPIQFLFTLNLIRRRKAAEKVIFALLCLFLSLAGILRGYTASERMKTADALLYNSYSEKNWTGTIAGKKYKNDRIIYELKDGSMPHINVYSDDNGFCFGDTVIVKGRLIELNERENEGGFDEKVYLNSKNIAGKVEADEISYACDSDGQRLRSRLPERIFYGLMEMLWDLRDEMRVFYGHALPSEEGGILSAMCLGDKCELDSVVSDLYKDAGISHVLAISGLHISIVGGFIWRLLRKRLKLSVRISVLLSCLVVVLYGMLTGWSVSGKRAVIMYLVLMLSELTGGSYDMISSLSLAGIIILSANPFAIKDSGFILSFLAVAGTAAFAIPIVSCHTAARRLKWEGSHKTVKGAGYKPAFIDDVTSSVLFSFLIQIFLMPVTAFFFYTIPTYSILLNLVVIPLLGPLLACGLLGGLLRAGILVKPCHLILYIYEYIADHALNLPGSRLTAGQPSYFAIVIYYLILFTMEYVLLKNRARIEEEAYHRLPWRKHAGKGLFGRRRYSVVFFAFSSVLVVLLACHPIHRFELTMLSVGQGDGIFIGSEEGVTYFIDGGSTTVEDPGKYVIGPFLKSKGIDHIDYWIITHMDEDHYNGMLGLIVDGYPVRHVVFSKSVEQNDAYLNLLDIISQKNISADYMKPGDSMGTRTLKLTCLYPEYPSGFEGTNENSLVLYLQEYSRGIKNLNKNKQSDLYTFDCILTGDMGEDQERDILSDNNLLSRLQQLINSGDQTVEILKSAHHGSNYSNCAEWLNYISPEAVIISAGKRNRYGHPGKYTLARLKDMDIPYFCTKYSGQLTYKEGQLSVWKSD